MPYLRACLLPVVFSLLSSSLCSQDKLTQLSPELATVFLDNGLGSVSFVFAGKPTAGLPDVEVTDGRGTSNTIRKSDIAFHWEARPAKPGGESLFVGRISVHTAGFVEPGVDYKARVIFLWPDGRSQFLDFTIADRATLAFELSPEKVDVVLGVGEIRDATVRIKNVGRASIGEVRISSLGLPDASTQHRANLVSSRVEKLELPAGQEAQVSMKLGRPAFAGTYSGVLDFVADGKQRRSVPLTVRTRGPGPACCPWLPAVLFLLVVGSGFWLSSALEEWFGLGGLQRAQAIVSFRKSQLALTQMVASIQRWESGRQIEDFTHTKTGIQVSLRELQTVLDETADAPQAQLSHDAERFAQTVAFSKALWAAVQVATLKWPASGQKLARVVSRLDETTAADLNAYRAALRAVLQEEAAPGERGAVSRHAASALRVGVRVEDLQQKIRQMAVLQRAVVWAVVLLIAYQSFYAANYAFGTLLDYANVFLWTLGLTQTGTQILARARSSYTRP